MKLKLNLHPYYLPIIVFVFQSLHIISQTSGNEKKYSLVSEANPLLRTKRIQTPSQTSVVNSVDTKIDDEFNTRSLEKERKVRKIDMLASSSEESNFNKSSIITPRLKYTLNTSSEESEETIGSTKIRDTRKTDKWSAIKRNASANTKQNKSYSTSSSVTKSSYRKQLQSVKQKGRSLGETGEKLDNSDLHDQSNPKGTLNQKKPSGTHIKPTKTPDHGRSTGTKGHDKQKGSPGHNQFIETYGNSKIGINKIELLMNKTNRHPFSVKRLTMSVDPDVYSFFQYKPPQSVGLLWTQSAAIGGRGINAILGDFIDDEYELGLDDKDPSNLFDWESKRYDRKCLYVEYNENKQLINSSQVSEEISRIVDTQNEKLARRFLDWQFINKEDHEFIALKGEGVNHPHYLTYKFLTRTVEIFRDKICRNATMYASTPEVSHFAPVGAAFKAEANRKHIDSKLLPKAFINELFRLFLTLRDITLPKGVPDYASKKDEEDIYEDVLENCLEQDPIQWFSHTCADQVLSYDDPHNYACTPLVEYDFNYKEYDPILDGMWHMFTAVHGFCFDLFNKRNTRLLHKYSMIIVNSFTEGMRRRWKASIAEPKFYTRLLGPDYKSYMETMNRCMFAATLRSGAPSVLPRFLSVAPTSFEKERIIGKDAFEPHPKAKVN